MRRFRLYHLLAIVPILAVGLFLAGCGNKPPEEPDDGGGPIKPKPPKTEDLKELTGAPGKISGKVMLDGALPDLSKANMELLSRIEAQGDRDQCKKGDTTQQKWKVKDGAVQNVYVWLRPPDGSYFKLTQQQADPKQKVVKIQQPFCAFEPHANLLFPRYHTDGKTLKPTGQKFEVVNNAVMQHNTNWAGGSKNKGNNLTIGPGKSLDIDDLVPDYNTPVNISCTIHTWMNATMWVLDHPFAAITDADGNYTIEGAPTGVPLQVVAWHEVAGFLGESKNAKGDTMKLSDGQKIDFKVPAPK